MTAPQPSICLKLFCEAKRPEYFWCVVYADEKTMRAAFEHLFDEPLETRKGFKVHGVCVGHREQGSKCIGTVMLHRGDLHPMVLAHEFAHAATCYARYKKFNPLQMRPGNYKDGDERNATCVGHLMQQFYSQQAHRAFCVRGLEASAA